MIYLSKNGDWLSKDKEYINGIKSCLINISKEGPLSTEKAMKKKTMRELYSNIMVYCARKFQSRFKKLIKDLKVQHHDFSVDFLKFSSITLEKFARLDEQKISNICIKYYNKIKNNTLVPEKIRRHIKKVGLVLHHSITL
jgi:hypothetical protein